MTTESENISFDIGDLVNIKHSKLPFLNRRDYLNHLTQDIKFRYVPFRLYYKFRNYKYAKYRNPEIGIIKNLVQKDQNSLDVGANLGLFTYSMAKYSKRVFAFEPNPYPLRTLKYVIDKNVTLLPIALGSIDGVTDLKIPRCSTKGWSSNGASLGDKEVEDSPLHSLHTYKIQSRRLDSLDIENIGLIKVDIEGFELEFIKGSLKTIEKHKPNVIMENELVYNENPFLLFEVMQDCGYENYYCNSNGKLELLDNFSFQDNQKNPKVKDINYIQNFISIHKDKTDYYEKIINF